MPQPYKNKLRINDRSQYYHHAIMAVRAEQQGEYANALLRWKIASALAEKEIDRNWADSRREFCKHLLERR